MITVDEVSSILRNLLRQVFVYNCQIENSQITPEEDKDIQDLPILEIIENLKELIYNLLQFKQQMANTEIDEVNKRSEQFEKMLQKSEAEVRNHIRTENQLKLVIENNQSQIEELEKQNLKSVKEVKKIHDRLKAMQRLKSDSMLVEKIQQLEENLKDKERIVGKLENEILSYKGNLARSDSDFMLVGKNNEKVEEAKFRVIEGFVGGNKIKKFVNEKPMRPLRDRNVRKSAAENDLTRNIIYDKMLIKPEKIHFRSTSESIRPKSVGRRIPSR